MIRWLACILLFAFVRVADAAPPSGYACGDGKVLKGQGCQCPTGKVAARDAENTAVCVAAKPRVEPDQPTAATACMKDRKGKYPLKVDSTPPGATVYVGDKACGTVGTTPWAGLLNAGPALVIVEKDGHSSMTRTIEGKTGGTLLVSLSKVATSLGISSYADKNVDGAKLSIDGLAVGTAPMVKLVTPGRHLIELEKEGFEKFSQWIEAKPSERTTISPTLKSTAKAAGRLRLETTPAGAQVLINGIDRGRTPLELDLEVATYVVRLQLPGHRAFEQTTSVVAGQTITISQPLSAYR